MEIMWIGKDYVDVLIARPLALLELQCFISAPLKIFKIMRIFHFESSSELLKTFKCGSVSIILPLLGGNVQLRAQISDACSSFVI